MITCTRIRYAVCIGAATALLTSCGGSQPPIWARSTDSFFSRSPQPISVYRTLSSLQAEPKDQDLKSNVTGYKLLHSFDGASGGQDPQGLSAVDGSLYGATAEGGDAGDGTVFQSTLSGKVDVLHSFLGGMDGAQPSGGLTKLNASLYAVTYGGGGSSCPYRSGCGIVYSISSGNKEQTFFRFKPDNAGGWSPQTAPIVLNGSLYGTTTSGGEKSCGSEGCGTIYSLDTNGKERVIYRFKGDADGCYPTALVALKGTLYGITEGGGAAGSGCGGPGTVFNVTPSGREKVLSRFKSKYNSDGYDPSGLIVVNTTLYGTTFYGGSQACEGGNRPCGVVFSMTTDGREKVLYAFKGGADGAGPVNLIALNNDLYGVTCCGGSGSGNGYGTVFKINSDVKTTLYRFKGPPDGFNPAMLTSVNGLLYGVTGQGGTGYSGTIYKIAP